MDNFVGGGYTVEEQMRYFAAEQEKKALRRAAWAVCVPGMVFFFVTLFWSQIVLSVCAELGLDKNSVLETLRNPAVLQIIQVCLSLLLLTVPFVICAKIAGFNISSGAGLIKPQSENNFAYFLFGLGFCSFANIAVSAAGRIFQSFGINYSAPKNEDPEGVFGFLLVVVSTAIVPALVEEFAFRGIVFGLLKPFGEAFAIIASAAVFGVLHGNFEQIPFAFLVGLILGFVRAKTNSLVICMLIHAANNFIATLISYSSFAPAALVNILYTVYIMLALTLSVLSVAYLKGKNAFALKKADTVNTLKKTYFNFFLSPAFIIFFLLFMQRAVEYIF